MEQQLREKIKEAMKESFVGNYIFTDDELTNIYKESRIILKNVVREWGADVSYIDYDLIFVAVVNLAKDWNPDEKSLFDYIICKLMDNDNGSSKLYCQIIKVINKLANSNKIFMLKSYTKKYYATLCSHSFAPLSSIKSFFEMCWNIYCKDLDQEYEKNHHISTLITQSLYNKFNSYGASEDDLTIESVVYSFRAGIRGLAIDEQDLMTSLLDTTIESINSLFNNEPIKHDRYINVLIENWWKEKEEKFGIIKLKKSPQREHFIEEYSQIKAKYVLDSGIIKIVVPPIRLLNNYDYKPYMEIKVNDNSVICFEMETKGSGIIMSTSQMEYPLGNLQLEKTIGISIVITHHEEVIYDSKESLYREFILFNNSKEVMTQDCLPGIYFLYTTCLEDMFQYPRDIHSNYCNTYSFEAFDGEVLQSNSRTVFFSSEKTDREIYFIAKERNDVIYLYNDEEYKVIDGDLYIDIFPSLEVKNYGIRYQEVPFKLMDFSKTYINGKIRYNISSLLNVGERQHITIFKYSDNSLLASINMIKFNNIDISFDKSLYYDKENTGFATFKTEKYNKKIKFDIMNDEVSTQIEDGKIILNPPLLKWKIDDGKWHKQKNSSAIWYKDIANSSMLYIDLPKMMSCTVILDDDNVLNSSDNSLKFKLGQKIFALKETIKSTSNYFKVSVKINDDTLYNISDIYYKETFLEEPLCMFYNFNKFYWNPTMYIGDKDSRFRLDIMNDKSTCVYSIELTKNKESYPIDLREGYYSYRIILLEKGFLHKKTEIFSSSFVYGNEKKLKFKGKNLVIKEVMLFDKKEPVNIKTLYIDKIEFLYEDKNYKLDCYSGYLYLINKNGTKDYLNKMKNEFNDFVRVNPLKIEIKNDNSCYLEYGLDKYNEEFEFDGEFMIDYQGKITICKNNNKQKNKGINYFLFEVKNNV